MWGGPNACTVLGAVGPAGTATLADALAAFAQTHLCTCLSSVATVALLQLAAPWAEQPTNANSPAALLENLHATLEPVRLLYHQHIFIM